VQDERTAKTLEGWGCEYLQGALIGLASLERPWLAGKVAGGVIRTTVMAGFVRLVPAIHVFLRSPHKDVDAREQARA
jgi:hypothetical protein